MGRKTISFTDDLERRIRAVAESRGVSFSAAVLGVLDDALSADALPYEGVATGAPRDLAERAEEYLDKLAVERRG